ncbi:MAG: Jag N-terminal domain-containing protein, partial [Eubacterium sp.]|nr:Jag N-terminal domain-containing protein [Eubacterium sp.]
MDYIEISGKTVDDALTEALVKLETTSDKVDVEVVEKGSSGILGLFNKPAVIRVRRKKDKDILEEDVVAEVFHEEAKKEEPAVVPATEKKPEMTREEVESRIRNFLSDLFNAMDMEVAVEITFNDKEECINVELKGGNMGVLIGKRGQTLDS